MPPEILGIDIGGVIIKTIDAGSDTSFHNDFLKTPAVDDAIDTIRDLINLRFGDKLYLVSKCGLAVEALTWDWLNAHFFPRCPVNSGLVRFCRRREDKADICSALGVTHFIDDRLEVLGHLGSVENRYLFQPRTEEVHGFAQHLHGVHVVQYWRELRHILLPGEPAAR